MRPVVPQPPFCRSSLRQNHIPLPSHPENPDPKRLLEDELKGPVDPAVARELGHLMWMQQKRVWGDRGDYSDPFLGLPIPISSFDTGSSSSREGAAPVRSGPEMIALYGPVSRNNESIHLGEGLANPKGVGLDGDEGCGFGEVLDLYRGAVQGSALSMELELAVGGDAELTGVGWGIAGSLEVSIDRGPQELRIRTLAEYERVVKAENAVPLLPKIPKEEPPLGIKWSYSSYGYSTGEIVDTRKATTNKMIWG